MESLDTKVTVKPPVENKKVVAAICAILIGYLGIHKFILGYNTEGIIYLVVNIIVIPIFGALTCGVGFSLYGITYLIPVIEGIIYITKSDEDFINTYQINKKPWF